uniref:15-cis-phytoene synthase n=1 Tax=Tanacetum cinerariifolium TaxID=118510 RepID=A0A699GMX7_TANCI|nr:hypothetical protein [Tanacetum cinerariifolium]
MSVEHYENFPVASILLPKKLRPAVRAIYAFARSADDLADEGDATPAERLAALTAYEAALDRIAAGDANHAPMFDRLAQVVHEYALPLAPLYALLSAFKQDVTVHRYATYDALLDYCARSANPVGHLMLHLRGDRPAQGAHLPAAGRPGPLCHPAGCAGRPGRPPALARHDEVRGGARPGADAAGRAAGAAHAGPHRLRTAHDGARRAAHPRRDRARGIRRLAAPPQIDQARLGQRGVGGDADAEAACGERPVQPARSLKPVIPASTAMTTTAHASDAAAAVPTPAPLAATRYRNVEGRGNGRAPAAKPWPRVRVGIPGAARDSRQRHHARAQRSAGPPPHQPPAAVIDKRPKDRAKRLQFLLQLPVPHAGASSRHYRPVRVLPRGGRYGGRLHRRIGRAHQAGMVAQGNRQPVRRQAKPPRHPGAATAPGRLRPAAAALAGHHRRHGDGPQPDPLPRLRGAHQILLARGQRGGHPVGQHLWRDQSANPAVCRKAGPRVPAHQHHPRRGRRCAQGPHLSAGQRTAKIRRDRCRPAQRPSQRQIRAIDGVPGRPRPASLRRGAGPAAKRGPPRPAPGPDDGRHLPHRAQRSAGRRLPRADPAHFAHAHPQAVAGMEDLYSWLIPSSLQRSPAAHRRTSAWRHAVRGGPGAGRARAPHRDRPQGARQRPAHPAGRVHRHPAPDAPGRRRSRPGITQAAAADALPARHAGRHGFCRAAPAAAGAAAPGGGAVAQHGPGPRRQAGAAALFQHRALDGLAVAPRLHRDGTAGALRPDRAPDATAVAPAVPGRAQHPARPRFGADVLGRAARQPGRAPRRVRHADTAQGPERAAARCRGRLHQCARRRGAHRRQGAGAALDRGPAVAGRHQRRGRGRRLEHVFQRRGTGHRFQPGGRPAARHARLRHPRRVRAPDRARAGNDYHRLSAICARHRPGPAVLRAARRCRQPRMGPVRVRPRPARRRPGGPAGGGHQRFRQPVAQRRRRAAGFAGRSGGRATGRGVPAPGAGPSAMVQGDHGKTRHPRQHAGPGAPGQRHRPAGPGAGRRLHGRRPAGLGVPDRVCVLHRRRGGHGQRPVGPERTGAARPAATPDDADRQPFRQPPGGGRRVELARGHYQPRAAAVPRPSRRRQRGRPRSDGPQHPHLGPRGTPGHGRPAHHHRYRQRRPDHANPGRPGPGVRRHRPVPGQHRAHPLHGDRPAALRRDERLAAARALTPYGPGTHHARPVKNRFQPAAALVHADRRELQLPQILRHGQSHQQRRPRAGQRDARHRRHGFGSGPERSDRPAAEPRTHGVAAGARRTALAGQYRDRAGRPRLAHRHQGHAAQPAPPAAGGTGAAQPGRADGAQQRRRQGPARQRQYQSQRRQRRAGGAGTGGFGIGQGRRQLQGAAGRADRLGRPRCAPPGGRPRGSQPQGFRHRPAGNRYAARLARTGTAGDLPAPRQRLPRGCDAAGKARGQQVAAGGRLPVHHLACHEHARRGLEHGAVQRFPPHAARAADRLVEGARPHQPYRQPLDGARQQVRIRILFAVQAFAQQPRFDAFQSQPALQVAGQRTGAARARHFLGHALLRPVGQQVEVNGGVAVGRDLVAQRSRQRVDQAAFHPAGRDHELALFAQRLPVRAGGRDGDRRQGLARVAAAEMRAPIDVEAAVGRNQGSDVHAALRQQRNPGAVRPQPRPAAAAQGQHHGIRPHQHVAVRAGERQRAVAAPAGPPVAHVEAHAVLAQAVQPGAQQRRGLHIGRKHPAGRAHERFHPQAVHPGAHVVGTERVEHGTQRTPSAAGRAVARDEVRIRFGMGDVHAAAPGQQEFAAHRRHGVVDVDAGAAPRQGLGGHQAGGAATDDGDAKRWQTRLHGCRSLHNKRRCYGRIILAETLPAGRSAAMGDPGRRGMVQGCSHARRLRQRGLVGAGGRRDVYVRPLAPVPAGDAVRGVRQHRPGPQGRQAVAPEHPSARALKRATAAREHRQPPVTGGKNATSAPSVTTVPASHMTWLQAMRSAGLASASRQASPRAARCARNAPTVPSVHQLAKWNETDHVAFGNGPAGGIVDHAVAPHGGREHARALVAERFQPPLLVDARAQKFIAAVGLGQVEIGAHGKRPRRHRACHALQAQDERPHEHQKGDKARHRIAGQAHEKRRAHLAKRQRLARLDGDLPHGEPAFRFHGRLDMVFLAHRHAARRDDQVMAPGRLAQHGAGGVQRIGHDAEVGDVAAEVFQQRAQGETVRIVDRARRQRLARHGQLVAREEHGHAQLAPDRQLRQADRGGQAQLLAAQAGAGRQDHAALADILAGAAYPFAGFGRVAHGDHAVGEFALLLHHDGIGAGGYQGAREDAGGGAGLQGLAHVAGRDALGNRQPRGQRGRAHGAIGRAHGVAVHLRVVLARHVHGGDLRLRQHAAVRFERGQQRDVRHGARGGQHLRQGLGHGFHRLHVGLHDREFLRQVFDVLEAGGTLGVLAQRVEDGFVELGGQRGFQHDHRHARLQVFARDLDAVGGMGVDHDAVIVGHVADGVQAVVMGRFARLEAVLGHQLELVAVAARLAGQVEAALGLHLVEQGAGAFAVAARQFVHEAFEVGRLGDVHRRAAGVVRLGRLTHAVHASAEKFVEHIVFVGGGHQFCNRQAHHAGDVARADIAEVTRRHGERHLLVVRRGGGQVAAEVVHDLRHHARPVDRIDGADLVLRLERQIVGDGFHHVLGVVEHAFDGDIEDIRVLQAEHLGSLERAHFFMRRQHEHADAALAAHCVFGSAARVARRGAENVELGVLLGQRIFEQVAQQLHGHVLERQRGAVRQRLQDQPGALDAIDVLFQQAQRRDLARVFIGTGVAVHLGRVSLGGQRAQVGFGNVGGEFAQDLERQIRVRQLAPGVELGAGHLRIFGRQEQAAVGGQAAKQNIRKLLGIRRSSRRLCCAGRHAIYFLTLIFFGMRDAVVPLCSDVASIPPTRAIRQHPLGVHQRPVSGHHRLYAVRVDREAHRPRQRAALRVARADRGAAAVIRRPHPHGAHLRGDGRPAVPALVPGNPRHPRGPPATPATLRQCVLGPGERQRPPSARQRSAHAADGADPPQQFHGRRIAPAGARQKRIGPPDLRRGEGAGHARPRRRPAGAGGGPHHAVRCSVSPHQGRPHAADRPGHRQRGPAHVRRGAVHGAGRQPGAPRLCPVCAGDDRAAVARQAAPGHHPGLLGGPAARRDTPHRPRRHHGGAPDSAPRARQRPGLAGGHPPQPAAGRRRARGSPGPCAARGQAVRSAQPVQPGHRAQPARGGAVRQRVRCDRLARRHGAGVDRPDRRQRDAGAARRRRRQRRPRLPEPARYRARPRSCAGIEPDRRRVPQQCRLLVPGLAACARRGAMARRLAAFRLALGDGHSAAPPWRHRRLPDRLFRHARRVRSRSAGFVRRNGQRYRLRAEAFRKRAPAPTGGSAHPVPGPLRSPHRPAQPGAVAGARAAGAGACARPRRPAGADDAGPRQLQGHQRFAGPQRGRRPAVRTGQAVAGRRARGRHGRAARRRRIHFRAEARPRRAGLGGGAQADGADRAAAARGRARPQGDHVDRHRPVSRRRQRHGNADAARGRGHVPGQARRPPRLPLLHGRHAPPRGASPATGQRAALCRGAGPDGGGVPAAGVAARPAHRGRRSAAALVHAGTGNGAAGRIHSGRRGKRPDTAHRRVGAAPGRASGARLARRRPAARGHCRQPVGHAVSQHGAARPGRPHPAGGRAAARIPGTGTDRRRGPARPAGRHRHDEPPARARGADVDRRFWHRLLVAEPPEKIQGVQAEDRPVVRARHQHRRRGQGHRQRHHQHGAQPGAQDDCGRGGNGGTAGVFTPAALRRDAGVLFQQTGGGCRVPGAAGAGDDPCQRCRGDGLDGAHAVTFDARNLHQPADGIARHAQVVLDADFGGVLDLQVGAAQRRHQAGGGHRARHAHFALAAHFGARDRRIALAQHADAGCREHEVADAGDGVARLAVLGVVAQHGWDDAGRAVGGRRYHAPARRVFLVDGHRIQADLVQRIVRQVVGRGVVGQRLLPQARRAALDVQAAGQDAVRVQSVVDTVAHHVPDAVDAGIEVVVRHACALVRAQHLRDGQARGLAVLEQLVHGVERVRNRRARVIGRRRVLGFAFLADKAAAYRVVHLADGGTVTAREREAHAVRVLGQRFGHVEDEVDAPFERHLVGAQQRQLAGFLGRRQLRVHAGGHHVLRRLAHQAQDHRLVGGVADAGQRQRAVQLGRDAGHAIHAIQRRAVEQEAARGHHGAHRVRTRWSDTDLEQIENTHVHLLSLFICLVVWFRRPCSRGLAQVDIDVGQHVGHHLVDADARLPAPVGGGGGVVEALRPRVGNRLAAVRDVSDLEVRDRARDGGGQLLRVERHARHVVRGAHLDLFGRRVHQFDGGADGVGHVDHRQRGVRTEEACVPLAAQGRVEDGNRIIGGAAARGRLEADDAGVADAAHVHAVLDEVILAQALAGQLADAVDGGRVHHRRLRGVHGRRGRAESGNRRRPEHLERLADGAALARHFQDVEQAVHVQGPRLQRRRLAGGRQHGRQLVHLGDAFLRDQRRQRFPVQHVERQVARRVIQVGGADVGGKDIVGAVLGGQRLHQFAADLAVGADDEDALGRWRGWDSRIHVIPDDLLARVGGGQLHAHACLAHRHHRVEKARQQHAQFIHARRELLRHRRLEQHHRHHRVRARLDGEADARDLGAEVGGVFVQAVAQRGRLRQALEHGQRGAGNRRRQRVGEQVRARLLAQHVDHFLARRRKTAHGAAQRLAQRARDDVDAAHDVVVLVGAAAGGAHEARRVALVDHHQRAVAVGQVADLVELGDGAVHREHAVGDDHLVALAGGGLQLGFQVGHVVVSVAQARGLAQADAVNDRGVVQGVRNNGVVLVEQRFEHAAVGVEGGCVQDGVFGAEEGRDRAFQLLVHGLRAADETHRRQAVAVFFGGVDGRLRHPLFARQAQVVIGAHIDQGAAVLADHFGALARRQYPLRFVQAVALQLGQRLLQAAEEGVFGVDAHDGPCL